MQSIIKDLIDNGYLDGDVTPRPLAGGVSSDIFLVEGKTQQLVLKRALPQLKVKDDWHANTSRNAYEQKYMRFVSSILPESVPTIIHSNDELGYFVMAYLPATFQNWKTLLLDGAYQKEHATRAGEILGTIHAASFDNAGLASTFDSDQNFFELRLDPYLHTCGQRHPKLHQLFENEAKRIAKNKQVLVHGDFSPKNILVNEQQLVVLDCEVAWYGDPAFDIAFLLNHFFLKALYHGQRKVDLDGMTMSFINAYHIACRAVPHDALSRDALEAQICHLLQLLLLARVDGKSPVEYLDEHQRTFARDFVYSSLPMGIDNLQTLCQLWQQTIQESFQ